MEPTRPPSQASFKALFARNLVAVTFYVQTTLHFLFFRHFFPGILNDESVQIFRCTMFVLGNIHAVAFHLTVTISNKWRRRTPNLYSSVTAVGFCVGFLLLICITGALIQTKVVADAAFRQNTNWNALVYAGMLTGTVIYFFWKLLLCRFMSDYYFDRGDYYGDESSAYPNTAITNQNSIHSRRGEEHRRIAAYDLSSIALTMSEEDSMATDSKTNHSSVETPTSGPSIVVEGETKISHPPGRYLLCEVTFDCGHELAKVIAGPVEDHIDNSKMTCLFCANRRPISKLSAVAVDSDDDVNRCLPVINPPNKVMERTDSRTRPLTMRSMSSPEAFHPFFSPARVLVCDGQLDCGHAKATVVNGDIEQWLSPTMTIRCALCSPPVDAIWSSVNMVVIRGKAPNYNFQSRQSCDL